MVKVTAGWSDVAAVRMEVNKRNVGGRNLVTGMDGCKVELQFSAGTGVARSGRRIALCGSRRCRREKLRCWAAPKPQDDRNGGEQMIEDLLQSQYDGAIKFRSCGARKA